MAKAFQVDTGGTLLTSLVSYWQQEDLTDFYSTNDQTGVNTPTFTAGKVNNALTLVAASTQYTNLTRTGFPTGTTDRSLSVWVYANSLPTDTKYIFSYGTANANQEFGINVQKSGTNYVIQFDRYNAGDSGTVSVLTTGSWIHFIFIYDGTANTLKVYKNGSLADTISTGTVNTGTADFGIMGSRADHAAAQLWDGQIDEVGLWSKQLSTQEITDLYNSGSGQTMITTVATISSFNSLLISGD